MKVAFIAHVFPRLHNTFILNEIVELIERGVDISIFSLSQSRETVSNEDVIKFDLLSRTSNFEDFAVNQNGRALSYTEYMAPFRKKEIICHFEAVAERLKEERFDIIHGILGNRPATAAMILSALTNIPYTFEAHAYDLFVDFPFSRQKIESVSFISTESHYNRNFLVHALGAPAEKVHIVHLSPNKRMLDRIEPTPHRDDILISTCRLHPIKGLTYALQAVSKVKAEFPSLQYVIIGGGELKEELMQEADALNLEDTVHFVDDVPNEEVCRVVRQAGIFLLPSVIADDGDRDGTPTAIAEAMYLEVPIVSSRVTGIPELVDDGVSGILTDPANVEQIADALRKLLSSRELREKMGTQGKEKVEREFSIEKNAAKLHALWQDIIMKRGEMS